LPLPRYFCASCRRQRNSVSGVTIVATSARSFRPSPLAFSQTPALVVREPQAPLAQLFAKDTILFAQVFDYGILSLLHPSGKRDHKKPERIAGCRHVVASL